jgi:peptidoglycan/xylan/chitin deacetylase (PgdA/CDA1 family)
MDQFGRFVVSLDFELMWGLRDHLTVNDYGQNILGVREAIPRMLDAFDRFGIRATWATVGFLFCESKDELIATAPAKRPTYSRAALSNYSYFDEIGCNEKDDPYFFGLGLLQLIRSCNGQEIGSHTFSHYYCLEDGQTDEQFSADLDAACTVASRRNIILKSLVFPRNQYSQAHLKIAASHGFCVFRGNEKAAAYRPAAGNEQSKLRRALRLADNYLNLTGNHVHGRGSVAGLEDVQPLPAAILGETGSPRRAQAVPDNERHERRSKRVRRVSSVVASPQFRGEYRKQHEVPGSRHRTLQEIARRVRHAVELYG